jgi:adenosylmethionine-8-amino-7-oxononanoate aminotransferase
MEDKTKEFAYLRQWAAENVWVPVRPWNLLTSPGGFHIFTEGSQCRITDINGKTYLDYWGTINGLNAVGYGRKEIATAVYEQILKLQTTPTHDLTIPKIRLAKKVADIAPTGSLSKVFFGCSGTESIETGLKIARKYQILSGFHNKRKVIGGYTYHGSTFGAMSTGWRGPSFTWEDFEPLMPDVIHVASPYCSKCEFGLEYPHCNLLCAKQVEKVIQLEVPETVAAFLDTPIASACFIPPPEYWPMIRSICDKYGVLLILDCVVTGFGRTGKMFGIEHYPVVPDIIVVGKAFASGYVPISAAIVRREIAKKFEGGPNEMLKHSYTFEGHPGACAAALANLEIIEKERLVENSKMMGTYLFEQLQLLYKHRIVGEIRGGLGLMCEVELVKDKKTKEEFSPKENGRINAMLRDKLPAAGLFGPFRNPLSVCPSLIITKDEIDEIVIGFDTVIGEIEKELSK